MILRRLSRSCTVRHQSEKRNYYRTTFRMAPLRMQTMLLRKRGTCFKISEHSSSSTHFSLSVIENFVLQIESDRAASGC